MIMRSVVLFIALCITLACADTCVPISKNQPAGSATSFKLQNTLGFNIVPTYYSTSSSNVELAATACSDDPAAANGLKFDFAMSGSSIVLTTSTTYNPTTTTAPATATTTTAPGGSTPGPIPTTDKSNTVTISAAQRVAPFSTLLAVVAGLMLIFRPQSQSSILVVLVMICALYYVQAASTITINVRIGLPDTITQTCDGSSCSARSTGGVTNYVTVFGNKFAAMAACADFTAMPEGWRVADSSNSNTLVAIAFKSWGVGGVVVANGSVFAAGAFNTISVANSVLTTQNDATKGTMYKVDSCTYQILIQGFSGPDSNPIVANAGALSNFVSFMGFDYATLDNMVYTSADGSVSGQSGGLFLPASSAWQVAPFDDNTLVALSSPGSTINNAFSAACLVTLNGAAYSSIAFSNCSGSATKQLVAATYTAGNIYATVGANQRVLVRRVSAKGTGNTWPTSVSVFSSIVAGSSQFAMIDNKDPLTVDASQCQARYYTVPSGWSIPSVISDFAPAVIGKNVWTNTTCFVAQGTSMDQSGASGCGNLQTKNISGTIFYGSDSCARVILQRSNNKLTSFTMGMKILFIHENIATSYSDAGEVNLFQTMMQALGIPYTDMPLSDANNDLIYSGSLPLLDGSGNPLYYAIVFSTLTPKYAAGAGYAEALTPDQKNQILQYCYQYGVRRVMLNGYPADSGFTVTGSYNQTGTYIQFNSAYASANANLFSGIKTNAAFLFGNYYSLVAKDPRLTPVFHVTPTATTATSDSNIAAGIVTETNGIQSLQFYFGNPGQFLDHGPVLANYWVDWVTRGVWMGQRRVYFSPQIDDYFLGTAQYGFPDDGNHEVKCNNTDIDESAAFLTALSADTTKVPAGSRVTLTMALNCAEGDLAEKTSKLITAARKWQEYFFWESHTWSHMDMTKNPEEACEFSPVITTPSPNNALNCHNSTYDECYAELSKNNDFIIKIWPNNGTNSATWSKNSMITPAITGLFNPAALKALYDNNMTCVVGDNSRSDLQTDNFYLGFYTTVAYNGFDGIFIIPRFATNIYYNTATPAVNIQQYNDRYGPQGSQSVFPTNHTLDMILDAEGSANFRHMAFFRHDPFMFHQCNLHHFWYSYKGTGPMKSWSLVELWLQTVIDKYSTFLNFPLIGVKQQDLRDVYFARREREFCGLSGTINVVPGATAGTATWDKITVQSTGSCRPAITGISSCGSTSDCTTETYATDNTLWTGMTAGVGKQITVNKPW